MKLPVTADRVETSQINGDRCATVAGRPTPVGDGAELTISKRTFATFGKLAHSGFQIEKRELRT